METQFCLQWLTPCKHRFSMLREFIDASIDNSTWLRWHNDCSIPVARLKNLQCKNSILLIFKNVHCDLFCDIYLITNCLHDNFSFRRHGNPLSSYNINICWTMCFHEPCVAADLSYYWLKEWRWWCSECLQLTLTWLLFSEIGDELKHCMSHVWFQHIKNFSTTGFNLIEVDM